MDRIGLVGLSWRRGGPEALTRFTLPAAERAEGVRQLARAAGVSELVYLATCNRVEVLFAGDGTTPLAAYRPRLFEALAGRRPSPGEAERTLLAWAGEGAVEHLFLVAVGLDSARLARLGDVYVNDAFSAAHRAHASVVGVARILPAAAGRLMQAELEALDRALENPARPVAAVIGGAKVSTKLDVLGHLVGRVEMLVIGGGMANTFLHALGVPVGRSLCERGMADVVHAIVARAKESGCDIVLPTDAVTATRFEAGAPRETTSVKAVGDDAMILDIGPATAEHVATRLGAVKTVVWNGPLGAFELDGFDQGTNLVARAVAERTREGRLVSVAGGGDTVAALARAGVIDDFTYVSTAGGAFLEWLEGKELPGVAALEP